MKFLFTTMGRQQDERGGVRLGTQYISLEQVKLELSDVKLEIFRKLALILSSQEERP